MQPEACRHSARWSSLVLTLGHDCAVTLPERQHLSLSSKEPVSLCRCRKKRQQRCCRQHHRGRQWSLREAVPWLLIQYLLVQEEGRDQELDDLFWESSSSRYSHSWS